MRATKQDKEYLLDFLMKSNSLHDLLGILASICENLNLGYLNPRIKHFRYFQFTFFGLMVKAKSLLDMVIFKAEFLKNSINEFNEIYSRLKDIERTMKRAYNLIYNKKMNEGKIKIIELNKEYSKTFKDILKISNNII